MAQPTPRSAAMALKSSSHASTVPNDFTSAAPSCPVFTSGSGITSFSTARSQNAKVRPQTCPGGGDGPDRRRMAQPDLPLDPRARGRDVDRPPLVLQLRQRPGGQDLRRRLEEESGPRDAAPRALLVPLGRHV